MNTPPDNIPHVTIVTPVYNEEASLERYRDAVASCLFSRNDVYFEVLFVDDGSVDRSWETIEQFCSQSPRFRAVRLSRNFGAHTALTAGIDEARGDAIAILACDLQDPPEVLLEFVDKWQAGAQIVWGCRRNRDEARSRIWTSNALAAILRKYAIPKGSQFVTGSFLLMDQLVAECFRQFRESNRITFALVAWTGFRQETVLYDRRSRVAGVSGYKFGARIKSMYDALIGFSNVLPRFITLLGAAIFLMNIPLSMYLIADYIFARPSPGWTGLMLALCFFFGVVCLMLGIMSEYLHRIYLETTGRPIYFIAQRSNALKTDRLEHTFRP